MTSPTTDAARRAREGRRVLDRRWLTLPTATAMQPPRSGWIRAVRQALGMSLGDLAARLGMTHQSVSMLEQSERAGQIKLSSLRKAADAMDCDLAYVFIPRSGSLQGAVDKQARAQLAEHMRATAHSQRLEDQTPGEVDDDAIADNLEQLIRSRALWKT
ncbi:MAG: mobile mystery protein A [Actinomycetota bacterium]|nr:mobile mystery protein A [Actinomycetota bacterium]MDQ2955823.1 mobile mystery protein A [Actinomycetota bacterium]